MRIDFLIKLTQIARNDDSNASSPTNTTHTCSNTQTQHFFVMHRGFLYNSSYKLPGLPAFFALQFPNRDGAGLPIHFLSSTAFCNLVASGCNPIMWTALFRCILQV